MSKRFSAVYPWMFNFNFKTPEELYVYAAVFGLTDYNGGNGFIGTLQHFYNFLGFSETGKTVKDLKNVINALREDGVIEVYNVTAGQKYPSFQIVATVGEFTYNKEDWTL